MFSNQKLFSVFCQCFRDKMWGGRKVNMRMVANGITIMIVRRTVGNAM